MSTIFHFLSLTFFLGLSLVVIFGCSDKVEDARIRVEVIDPSLNNHVKASVDGGVIYISVEAAASLKNLATNGNGFRVVPLKDTYLIYNGTNTEAFNFFSGITYFRKNNFLVNCIPIDSFPVDSPKMSDDPSTSPIVDSPTSDDPSISSSSSVVGPPTSIECRFIEKPLEGNEVDPSITFISFNDRETASSVRQSFNSIKATTTFMENSFSSYINNKYPIVIF